MIQTSQDLLQFAFQAAQGIGVTSKAETQAELLAKAFKISQNFNGDFRTNGEAEVLTKLKNLNVKNIIDVGANVGSWSAMATVVHPDAYIYSFEPIDEVFNQLSANICDYKNIIINNLACSDSNAELELLYYPEASGQTSLFYYPIPVPSQKKICQSIRIDDFAEQQGIQFIDFMKIDVEGAEHLVLKGAERLLGTSSIRCIQFEYGQININTRFLLKDFYEMFQAYGYVVGKIFPKKVKFKEYSLDDEDFIGPNYLAVHSYDSELLSIL